MRKVSYANIAWYFAIQYLAFFVVLNVVRQTWQFFSTGYLGYVLFMAIGLCVLPGLVLAWPIKRILELSNKLLSALLMLIVAVVASLLYLVGTSHNYTDANGLIYFLVSVVCMAVCFFRQFWPRREGPR